MWEFRLIKMVKITKCEIPIRIKYCLVVKSYIHKHQTIQYCSAEYMIYNHLLCCSHNYPNSFAEIHINWGKKNIFHISRGELTSIKMVRAAAFTVCVLLLGW